jgi:hypothetical protein
MHHVDLGDAVAAPGGNAFSALYDPIARSHSDRVRAPATVSPASNAGCAPWVDSDPVFIGFAPDMVTNQSTSGLGKRTARNRKNSTRGGVAAMTPSSLSVIGNVLLLRPIRV